MKTKAALLTLLFFFTLMLPHFLLAGDSEKKPLAQLLEPTYKFSPVIEGVDVTHDFILQNKGNADLVIKDVKPG